ncbi:unnamed protein product [Polarella glacialis]|uniref:PA14 domain-containing protein n=1 Tax=Polarella glacialis TaxID=89957 RepID=A0A813EAK2_POLGL|nr:unnamed protein product [Polarella glacialis]
MSLPGRVVAKFAAAYLLLALSTFLAGAATPDASCSSGPSALQQKGASRGTVLLQRAQSLGRVLKTEKTGVAGDDHLPDTVFFDAVIRDFTADHPDFQHFDGYRQGLVQPQLGPDQKPVFVGSPEQLSTKENFDQWFRDVPGVNQRLDLRMEFNKTELGTYVTDSENFYPIDGRGWNDSNIALDNKSHNMYFTLELHAKFVYQGGEDFTFRGDDDVWVFIDDKLVIDLGGVHDPMTATVALDTLGLTKGSSYGLSFFFAERRCCGSEFHIETGIRPVTATCTVWGEPHVDTFDNGLFGREKLPPLGIYSSGDYWLVKNSLVQIQGRYGVTQYSTEKSALLALAVGGPFLQNHTLVIEPMDDGKVTWDGEQILQDFPSEFLLPGFVRVDFHEGVVPIDAVLKGYQVKMVKSRMPRNVGLTVNRWPEHIDAIIRMPQQLEGQEGHCGNFNLDDSDDTQELILQRVGSQQVSAEESLFPDAVVSDAEVRTQAAEVSSLADCAPEVRAKAHSTCQAGKIPSRLLDACVFDFCFGGEEFAVQGALSLENFKDA